jgi:hypothetical protein
VQVGATVRLVVGAFFVVALTLGGYVQAAELPMPLKAPPLVWPRFDWSGFDFGIHMSYAWGRSGWTGATPSSAKNFQAVDLESETARGK